MNDKLHAAVCQAVAALNVYPTRDKEVIDVRNLLRQALVDYADAAQSAPPTVQPSDVTTVKIPTNADEAVMMNLVSESWLRTNAPERLKMAREASAAHTASPQAEAPVAPAEAVTLTKAQHAKLAEALRFYADPGDYKAPFTGGMGKLYFDCGTTARAALESTAKPPVPPAGATQKPGPEWGGL